MLRRIARPHWARNARGAHGHLESRRLRRPFAVLRFQYQLARIPLQLFEAQMAAWMGSEAPPRLFYERWLGGLDATVGNLLGDPKLEKRGAALIECSDALDRAAQLEATATQNHEQVDDELKAKRDNAIRDQKDARGERASGQGSADRCRTAEARRGTGCREADRCRKEAGRRRGPAYPYPVVFVDAVEAGAGRRT